MIVISCAKLQNKCLNVCERVEVVEWNKRLSPPFLCCPVSHQYPWKKTLLEKKSKNNSVNKIFTCKRILFQYSILTSWSTLMLRRLISLNCVVFSFKIYFSFSFCSDFNLEATVVKTDEIRGLKQLFTSCFLLIGKAFSKIINN